MKIRIPVTVLAANKFAKVQGMHAVGNPPGLYLCVKGQSRTWILRYMSQGRRRELSLGRVDEIPLAQAREDARKVRARIREGIDPVEERRAAKVNAIVARAKRITFAECAEKFIRAHEPEWKNPKHVQQWRNTLATYAFPVIGMMPVDSVDTTLVMEVLEPIWTSKNETASRLRGRIEAVLDWAGVRKYRQGPNPARRKGHLDVLLASRSKIQKVEHHAALPYAGMGAFMAALAKMQGMGARALEFVILTAARSGEVRGATWAEIDLAGKVWTVPGERMKADKEHIIPLSDQAMALLKALPRMAGTDLLFPGTKGPLSDMSLTAVMRRMEVDATVHGFRSSFRDWAGECTAHPREVIEHALAHQLKDKAEAAYARGTLLDKRHKLMADWGRYCSTVETAGSVVAIKRHQG